MEEAFAMMQHMMGMLTMADRYSHHHPFLVPGESDHVRFQEPGVNTFHRMKPRDRLLLPSPETQGGIRESELHKLRSQTTNENTPFDRDIINTVLPQVPSFDTLERVLLPSDPIFSPGPSTISSSSSVVISGGETVRRETRIVDGKRTTREVRTWIDENGVKQYDEHTNTEDYAQPDQPFALNTNANRQCMLQDPRVQNLSGNSIQEETQRNDTPLATKALAFFRSLFQS